MAPTTKIIGKSAAPVGSTPGIVLVNPRFGHNVGMVVRLASCYGIPQLWYTGDRVRLELEKKARLPREERMKGWRDVQMCNFDRPLEAFPDDVVPVAVEVRANSERLHQFEHPEKAVYVFGPEDGDIPTSILTRCHRFVVIPTMHAYCLNLATAVATVLYDRAFKRGEIPESTGEPVGHEETEPREMGIFDTIGGWP